MTSLLYVGLTVLNCFFGAIAAYVLKLSTTKLEKLKPFNKFFKSLFSSGFVLGAFIYFITALGSVFILRKLDVIIFFPLTSTTYIFSLLIAKKYLDEKITKYKVAGLILILCGVAMLV